MKTCTKCGSPKPLSGFHANRWTRDGLHGQCKSCRAEVEAMAKRKWKYKMTEDQYQALLLSQNHLCAICSRPFPRGGTVDHDHSCCSTLPTCGKCTRGLLCDGCNTRLSYVEGNEWTVLARAYLDKHDKIVVGN